MMHSLTQPRTSGYATASLVLGIVGVVLGWCLLFVPNLLAVVFGHLALKDVRQNSLDGHGYAVAGLIMGYTIPILGLIGVGLALIFG